MHDSGRWRELGVTHWHLTVTEVETKSPTRFSRERWEQIENTGYVGAVFDPAKALAWVTDQRRSVLARTSDPDATARKAGLTDLEIAAETTWLMLTRTTSPAGGAISINESQSVEIYANPMTALACSKRHQPEA